MTETSYSKVTLPASVTEYPTIKAFLMQRFPHIPSQVWEQRLIDGKVVDELGNAVQPDTAYQPGKRIYYFREVQQEPVIPFAEKIIYQDDHLLVACKPHFLPVNPTGPYVAECLMNRLRRTTGNDDLVPINRIDRETAGIVLFSTNRKTRDRYCELFREHKVEKSYEAIAEFEGGDGNTEWLVDNRIVSGEPWFRMKTASGVPNARSIIHLVEKRGSKARFVLHPLTGKTHQLRLHMSGLGFGILNDRYYPDLQPERADDFANPLQLLAKKTKFLDPISGESMEFISERKLKWDDSGGDGAA